MRKLALVMFSILAFTVVVSCINAEACERALARKPKPREMQFKEFLQGFVVGSGMTKKYGPWTAIKGELIQGTGNLMGSQIRFTLVSNRRFRVDPQKSFTNGRWTFLFSDGSQISGIFVGKGTSSTEFSGMFTSNESHEDKGKSHEDKGPKIMGTFSCKFRPPQTYTYGGSWSYEAWWNGTIMKVNK